MAVRRFAGGRILSETLCSLRAPARDAALMVGMAIFALGVASGVYLAVVIDWITLSRARRRRRGPAGRRTAYPLSAVRVVGRDDAADDAELAEIVSLRRRGAPDLPASVLYDWEREQEQS